MLPQQYYGKANSVSDANALANIEYLARPNIVN